MTDTEEKTTAFQSIFNMQARYAQEVRRQPLSSRTKRLEALAKWIHLNRTAIHAAIFQDFRKPSMETDATEIFHVLSEIRVATKNMNRWASRKKVDAPVTLLGTRSYISFEPKGVCLIISPWNYPFSLAVGPLVSALAAGNCVTIKPSELTPNVSALLSRMASDLFPPELVSVVEGDASVAQGLLNLPFNHIFFTGSPAVGKIVMRAAAEHLASVTLELGGKSPCVVDAETNIDEAAERIAVGKFINNGQTCIAPDYVLADEKIIERLGTALASRTKAMFSSPEGSIETSASYGRIVNDRHFNRLTRLLSESLDAGATLHLSGRNNADQRFFHPVIISNVSPSSGIMEEEIFGPVLPVIPYKSTAEVVSFINGKPRPLALYIFSRRNKFREEVLTGTSAGGVCVNDCAIHFLHHGLPFGGVNNSGMGKSHGYHGFVSFSNEKPVLVQKSGITTVRPFYPPYGKRSKKLMDWFLKLF